MKKMLFMLPVLLMVFLSCKKNVLSITNNNVDGAWTLKRITGGFAGIDTIPKDNITIRFEAGKYTSTFNNNVTATGNYTITAAEKPNYYYTENVLNLFSDSGNVTYGITVQNDSLALSESCCDQFNYLYTKGK